MSSECPTLLSSINATIMAEFQEVNCYSIEVKEEVRAILYPELQAIIEIVVNVFITGLVSVFGMITNLVNMAIFYKQGLTDTTNISLFSLAISDFFTVLTLEWMSVCFNPLFINAVPWETKNVMYLTGAWPHLVFGRISCWITVYITFERCLCIVLPLKVKQIFTQRRAIIIMCVIYLANVCTVVPTYVSTKLEWQFSAKKNISILTMVFMESGIVDEFTGFIVSAVASTVSFPAIIVCTGILVERLRRQSKWRMKSSKCNKQAELSSKRDVKTMKMIALVAIILIVCYIPGILTWLLVYCVPGFSSIGNHSKLFFLICPLATLFQAINASVNIFVYFNMSSKYRKIFQKICPLCAETNAPGKEDQSTTLSSRPSTEKSG